MSKELLIPSIVAEAQQAAREATQNFLAQHGDRDACGFAWVTVFEKGSTKLGRALLKNGFRKASGYYGLQMWNPSGNPTQCISAKEEGAYAAARVFQKYGIEAYAGSRLD